MVFTAPCKYCDAAPQVNMEKTASGWNVTNLDGSKHYHDRARSSGGTGQQQPQQTISVTSPVPQPTSYEADRQASIKEAHEENMRASQAHTKALNDLTEILKELVEQIRQKNYIDSHGESSA